MTTGLIAVCVVFVVVICIAAFYEDTPESARK